MVIPLVDRFRRLPPPAREACFAALGKHAGALTDLRHDFYGFWAREDQIVTVEELNEYSLIVFVGPRRQGKTRAAVQLFMREIYEGRAERPRIMAATEADVDKVVVHGASGIMDCMPPELRPKWLPSEGSAGVLRCRNGVDINCFSSTRTDAMVGDTCDLLLYDDVAKWQRTTAEESWRQSSAACSTGYAVRIAATTLRGNDHIRKKLLGGDMSGVLVKQTAELSKNRFNLSEKYHRQLLAEFGGTDWYRRELMSEDVSATSPFAGLDFDAPPIRVLEVPRESFVEVVVGVDPADGKGGNHDEWGIGAAGRRQDRHLVALEDGSGSYDDDEAATKALELCERWGARIIVVESNRGLARVSSVLKAAHYRRRWERGEQGAEALVPLPEIIGVTAKDGKQLRAGPLRRLYLEGVLHHATGLGVLERQQREWDPTGPKRPRQDDRIDWLVHVIMHLGGLSAGDAVSAAEQLDGLAGRTRAALRAARESGTTSRAGARLAQRTNRRRTM